MSLINESATTFKIRTCRICLDFTNCENMVLLEEQNGWLNLFEYCFGLSLTKEDEPRVLCQKCADNVTSYVDFKKRCLKSDIFWKSIKLNMNDCTDQSKLDNIVKNEDFTDYVQNVLENDPNNRIHNNMNEELFDISFHNDSNLLHEEEEDLLNSEIKVEEPGDIISIEPISFEERDVETDMEELGNTECLHTIQNNEVDVTPKCHEDVKIKKPNDSIKTDVINVYTCKKCKKTYEKKKCLLLHQRLCKVKKRKGQNQAFDSVTLRTSDKVCDKESKGITGQDQENPLFFCGLCKFTFTSISDLRKHLDEHWSNNDLVCKLCEYVGFDLAAIAAHRVSHCPPNCKTRFLCHICEKRKLSFFALQFHYRMEHLKKSGGFCLKCNREFTQLRAWKKHEQKHMKPGYICDMCGKKYFYKHMIIDHVTDHINPKQFICDACGKVFKRARYLRLHMDTVHVKTGPFKCTHCNRMYKSEHTLSLHQKRIARDKTLKCEVCFKTYISPTFLKAHMVMHSNERPYACHICTARYKAKSQLKIHIRSHTGDMPFKCELCPKTFASSQQLKVHSSVHTGVRRVKCLHCEKTFHSNKLMLTHCARRHKTEMAE